MPYTFYTSSEYKNKQSLIAKKNWKSGMYDWHISWPVKRFCKNPDCDNHFFIKHWDPRVYCSHSCSAHVGNLGQKKSAITRLRISKSVSLLPPETWERKTKPKIELTCLACKKKFLVFPYLANRRKYCSIRCSMTTIGRRTTSPKASKGISGIRKDIDKKICFYSTWEANVARVFNLIGIKWEYAPKIFDLGKHTYRPDFYLPEFNSYVEVKNFMGPYSLERDRLFRQKYPHIKLHLFLKRQYLQIKSNYKDLVDNWEY